MTYAHNASSSFEMFPYGATAADEIVASIFIAGDDSTERYINGIKPRTCSPWIAVWWGHN